MKKNLQRLKKVWGFPPGYPHASEQLVSAIGAAIGMVLVLLIMSALFDAHTAVIIIPSMGASAVLVFAMPHSPFSQPWSVLAGNVFSAVVGVCCYRWIAHPSMAASFAVGLAVAVMHLTRSMHPPGGATALAAVIGGPAIHDLGFYYAFCPTAVNCLLVLFAGVLFNSFFAWRRYPASLMRYTGKPRKDRSATAICERHVAAALVQRNVLVDVNTDELTEIIRHAQQLAQADSDAGLPEVKLGHFYSNDKPGQQWSVRQIVDERRSSNPAHDLVIYKVVEGHGLHRSGNCTRLEFARWVGSELQPAFAHKIVKKS